jgi:PAS domain-containing protein
VRLLEGEGGEGEPFICVPLKRPALEPYVARPFHTSQWGWPLSQPADDYGISFRPFFSQAFVHHFAAEFATGFALSPIQANPDSRIDGIPDVMPTGSGTDEGLSNRLAGPDAISVSRTEVLCTAVDISGSSAGDPIYFAHPDAFTEPEKLLTAYFRSSTVGLCILDSELRYLAVNSTLAAMNGIPPAYHIGKTVREVIGTPLAWSIQCSTRVLNRGTGCGSRAFRRTPHKNGSPPLD